MLKNIFVLACLALFCGSASATDYHYDSGPVWITNDTTLWLQIQSDHDGFCDNTSGSWNSGGDLVGGTGYPDVDCNEWSSNSPRSVGQDCGSGACTVSVTVYCPYLAPETDGWLTFTCTGSATDGVRAGLLGANPTKRGVRCGSIECGCVIYACNGANAPCPYAEFFGSPSPVGGNPANFVCQ